MFTIGRKILGLFLLVCIAAAPMACLNINKEPDRRDRQDREPNTEVNVGGDHGVTVEHDK
jgi:hypothetical protein